MKNAAHALLQGALMVCGVRAVAYLVQGLVVLPSLPLWWRMVCVATPIFLGIGLVAVVNWLWGSRHNHARH